MTKNRKNKSNARALAAHTGQSYRAAHGSQAPSLTAMGLTSDEADAWVKRLSEPGLHIISGDPGSGKSTAMAAIAREHVRFGSSVTAHSGKVLDIPGVEYLDERQRFNERFPMERASDVYFLEDSTKAYMQHLGLIRIGNSFITSSTPEAVDSALMRLRVAILHPHFAGVQTPELLTLTHISREGDKMSIVRQELTHLLRPA